MFLILNSKLLSKSFLSFINIIINCTKRMLIIISVILNFNPLFFICSPPNLIFNVFCCKYILISVIFASNKISAFSLPSFSAKYYSLLQNCNILILLTYFLSIFKGSLHNFHCIW